MVFLDSFSSGDSQVVEELLCSWQRGKQKPNIRDPENSLTNSDDFFWFKPGSLGKKTLIRLFGDIFSFFGEAKNFDSLCLVAFHLILRCASAKGFSNWHNLSFPGSAQTEKKTTTPQHYKQACFCWLVYVYKNLQKTSFRWSWMS